VGDTLHYFTIIMHVSVSAGAMLLYKFKRVVVGENQTFQGAEELLRSHGVQVDVLQSAECVAMMEAFIRDKPELWNEDIGVDGDCA
jgi:cytosine/creatinine deaminase